MKALQTHIYMNFLRNTILKYIVGKYINVLSKKGRPPEDAVLSPIVTYQIEIASNLEEADNSMQNSRD